MELEKTGVSMGKLIARALGSVLLLVPAISFALGLGPITMRSSLNQPLDAEIDIHSAQPGDLDGFAVRLATEEDFGRVNVERSAFLTSIQFKLRFRSDGSAYIHLTTRQNVTEPYLDFLIEARWPRGRALKEYTVLVDPPVLTAETPAPVEQASTAPVFAEPPKQVQQTRPAPRPQPVQPRVATRPVQPTPPPVRRAPPPAPRPVERAPAPTGDVDYGRVKRGDTLYEIARDTRPNESVSINQMMLAYLRDNPEAFVDGNINKLKAGYVLRIKDASSIADVSGNEALSEVRRQNLAWRESRGIRTVKQTEPDVTTTAALDDIRQEADTPAKPSKKAKTEGPRVKITQAGSEATSGSAGADAEQSEAAKVAEDLLVASDSHESVKQEAEVLDSRMAELDEQMQSMQRLIMLKDEELLALQNKIGQEPEQVAAKPETKPEPKSAPKEQPPAEAGMTDELLSDPILLGLAGLLVVAVVGWLVVRRRRMQGGFEESILNVGAGGAVGAAAATATAEGGPESAMVSDFVMSDMTGAQGEGSDVDAISEADVYLAYGRHQQAEDILRQALDKTPDQLDLQAKLLEVFHAAKNTDAFEEQARILHEKLGGDESNNYWMDIVPLGREICPHSDLFGGGGAGMDESLGEVSADEEDLLDFDFNADELEDTGATEVAAAAGGDDAGEELDFDMSSLDFDLDSTGDAQETQTAVDMGSMEMAEPEPAASAASDDGGLDFDLSFGEDDSSSAVEEEPQAMEMETTTETSDDLDFGGLDFETSEPEVAVAEPEEEAPLELSMDMDTEESAVASEDSMSLDFDQGADIVQLDTGGDDIDLDGELDEDIFSNVDEVGTKLDLAKAYVDMGDSDGARSILDEVLEEGDDSQKQQAEDLLAQMG